MKKKTHPTHLTILLTALAVTVCSCQLNVKSEGNTVSSSLSGDTPTDGSSNGDGRGGQTVVKNPLDKVLFSGQISGGPFDKMSSVGLDKPNQALNLMIPLSINPYITNISLGLNDIHNGTIRLNVDNTGETTLVLSIPLAAVIRGLDGAELTKTLPTGAPLPNLNNTALSHVSQILISGHSVKLDVYLGSAKIYAFLSSPYDPFFLMTYPIKNQDFSQTYGVFQTVPSQNGVNGGFLMGITLPDELAHYLSNYY